MCICVYKHGNICTHEKTHVNKEILKQKSLILVTVILTALWGV